MTVAAMRGGDGVAIVEMQADADAGRLLAGIEVHEAGDIAGGELVVHPLLELADGPHAAVGVKKIVARELQPLCMSNPPHFRFSSDSTPRIFLKPQVRGIKPRLEGAAIVVGRMMARGEGGWQGKAGTLAEPRVRRRATLKKGSGLEECSQSFRRAPARPPVQIGED